MGGGFSINDVSIYVKRIQGFGRSEFVIRKNKTKLTKKPKAEQPNEKPFFEFTIDADEMKKLIATLRYYIHVRQLSPPRMDDKSLQVFGPVVRNLMSQPICLECPDNDNSAAAANDNSAAAAAANDNDNAVDLSMERKRTTSQEEFEDADMSDLELLSVVSAAAKKQRAN